MTDHLVIAGRAFKSRLIVGTGKYRSFQEMARAHEASGADMVTVAVRRVNLTDRSKESLLDYIDRKKFFILPNTAGCYSADEAVRAARLGREVGLSEWVKLEVIGDEQTLFPETEELVCATKTLVKEGFIVLPYTNDDLIVARKLIDAGASADASRGSHRVRHGHSKCSQSPDFARADHRGSVDRGCGRGHGFGCDGGDGTWRRRRADEHGNCRRAGYYSHG